VIKERDNNKAVRSVGD